MCLCCRGAGQAEQQRCHVHGGPHAPVEFGFTYRPYWYVLVSRGWAVLSLNPVGSAGQGKEFADRLRGRWGERDLPEHLAAIDELVAEGLAEHGKPSHRVFYSRRIVEWIERYCARDRAPEAA
ncbi:prolyl oligopeptidase family serine peptidase [Sorangium sp. So ce363]|uniref:prolyl oligopeptidase family serine peptidase n=1 Tax=Sorangium sp. So ce363 TaxID=3133304 RepID=UPI003F62377C